MEGEKTNIRNRPHSAQKFQFEKEKKTHTQNERRNNNNNDDDNDKCHVIVVLWCFLLWMSKKKTKWSCHRYFFGRKKSSKFLTFFHWKHFKCFLSNSAKYKTNERIKQTNNFILSTFLSFFFFILHFFASFVAVCVFP